MYILPFVGFGNSYFLTLWLVVYQFPKNTSVLLCCTCLQENICTFTVFIVFKKDHRQLKHDPGSKPAGTQWAPEFKPWMTTSWNSWNCMRKAIWKQSSSLILKIRAVCISRVQKWKHMSHRHPDMNSMRGTPWTAQDQKNRNKDL